MRPFFPALLLTTLVQAQDAPYLSKVMVDNPWARATRIQLLPGGALPVEEHPERVLIFLSALDGKELPAEGQASPWQVAKGAVKHLAPSRRGLANTGSTPCDFIEVRLKPGAPPLPGPYPDGPEAAPAHIRCEYEDSRIRVLRIHVGPQEALPMHAHGYRLVVELTGSTFMTAAGGTGSIQGRDYEPGTTAWVDRLTWHKEMNASPEAYERITVEFKSGAPPLRRLKVRDTTLACSDQGNGPALVLIHGDGQDVRDLQGDGMALAKAHRLVAYSRRGHFPGTNSGPVPAEEDAEDLQALCRSLGLDRVVLVGRGSGAATAQRLAGAMPKLVRALVLVAPEGTVPASGTVKVISSAEATSSEALARVVQSYVSGLN